MSKLQRKKSSKAKTKKQTSQKTKKKINKLKISMRIIRICGIIIMLFKNVKEKYLRVLFLMSF